VTKRTSLLFACWLATFVPVFTVAADEARQRSDGTVELPAVKVKGAKLERFSLIQQLKRDGSFMRLTLAPVATQPDFLCVWIGGAWVGDEVVEIDGRSVAELKLGRSHGVGRYLVGDPVRLVLRRKLPGNRYEYFEVEAKKDRT
jgi:hypothetical protein